MSKTNKPFSAQVLSNAQAESHKSEFTEGDILFLKDKGIPIPADKVGTADSVDKGKIPIVKADGTWELGTIYAPIEADLSTITPVANTYYVHTGTTGTYTQGIIYLYTGSEYKAINGEGATKTSDLVNDSGFITKSQAIYVLYVSLYTTVSGVVVPDLSNTDIAMLHDNGYSNKRTCYINWSYGIGTDTRTHLIPLSKVGKTDNEYHVQLVLEKNIIDYIRDYQGNVTITVNPVGTTVVGNPAGTATQDLNKLQVGSTIFGIPKGAKIFYIECAPTNTTITATSDTFTADDLVQGTMLILHFTRQISWTQSNTLNINNTGAKGLYDTFGERNLAYYWSSGANVLAVYTGTSWILQMPGKARTGGWYGLSKVESVSLNGQVNLNPSFYAPTSYGTSGQMLRANGAYSAPTWTAAPKTYTHKVVIDNNGEYITLTITKSTSTPIASLQDIYDAGYEEFTGAYTDVSNNIFGSCYCYTSGAQLEWVLTSDIFGTWTQATITDNVTEV